MYNCSGLAWRFIVSNKLEMSARFSDEGANVTGADELLCPESADMAVLVLAEATRGAANNVERPPLSIFLRLGSGKLRLSALMVINLLSNY